MVRIFLRNLGCFGEFELNSQFEGEPGEATDKLNTWGTLFTCISNLVPRLFPLPFLRGEERAWERGCCIRWSDTRTKWFFFVVFLCLSWSIVCDISIISIRNRHTRYLDSCQWWYDSFKYPLTLDFCHSKKQLTLNSLHKSGVTHCTMS